MMSATLLSLIISVSASAWLYSKFFSRRAGQGNSGPAVIGTAVTGLIIFLVLWLTLNQIM